MRNNPKPLLPVNPKGLDDIANALLQDNSKSPQGDSVPTRVTNLKSPEKYIFLPGKNHGNFSYVDMFVSMDRTHQGKNWRDTHLALYQEGAFMPTIRQLVDFLNLLRSGRVHDGNARVVNKTKIDSILDEILTVRDPYRAEWLDADFKVKDKKLKVVGGKIYMNYEHTIVNGVVTPKRSEEMQGYLTADKTPGIDLDDWLKNALPSGLPSASVKDGRLYYCEPDWDNNSVAGFYANSVWASLNCNRNPSNTNGGLGVRACRAKK